MQVSGHVYTEEGKKVLALSGAWNGHLDMQPCDAEGDPLPGSQTTRLWQACLSAFPAVLRVHVHGLMASPLQIYRAFSSEYYYRMATQLLNH